MQSPSDDLEDARPIAHLSGKSPFERPFENLGPYAQNTALPRQRPTGNMHRKSANEARPKEKSNAARSGLQKSGPSCSRFLKLVRTMKLVLAHIRIWRRVSQIGFDERWQRNRHASQCSASSRLPVHISCLTMAAGSCSGFQQDEARLALKNREAGDLRREASGHKPARCGFEIVPALEHGKGEIVKLPGRSRR